MTNKEIIKELDQYIKEINAELMGKPDEVTGQYRNGPLLDNFLGNRSQLNVFTSFINLGGCASVDKMENLSKKLVIKRALGAYQEMLDLLEYYMIKLETMEI